MGLPRDVLIRRINSELEVCSKYLGANIPPVTVERPFPLEIMLTLRNIPAYSIHDGEVYHIKDHTFTLILDEEFGFRKPQIRWETPIFHPNIMMPSDGGFVCLRTLDKWEFASKLLSVVKGVEQLIMSPNPKSPFGTSSCMAASKYFIENESKFEVSVKYGGR